MTFDGFDAAMLVEVQQTFPMSLPIEGDGPTLQGALAQLGMTAAPDLWRPVGPGAGSQDFGDLGVTPLRPLSPDEMLLLAGNNVTVTGNPPDWWDPSLPNDPNPDGGGGGGGSGDDPGEAGQDCRDRHAIAAKNEINDHPDDGRKEHGSIIYRDANGAVQRSPVLHGNPDGIPRSVIEGWLASNGVAMSQVIGLAHNHDAWIYAQTDEAAAVNRYPSENDWEFAEWMVGLGAGGSAGAEGFALYVIDTAGQLREFEYGDRSFYETLSRPQKVGGNGLPDAMQGEGGSCG